MLAVMRAWGLLALFVIGLALVLLMVLEMWAADAWRKFHWKRKAKKLGWIRKRGG
jgi:hypothetical protein